MPAHNREYSAAPVGDQTANRLPGEFLTKRLPVTENSPSPHVDTKIEGVGIEAYPISGKGCERFVAIVQRSMC
jgi:hypothetical protein